MGEAVKPHPEVSVVMACYNAERWVEAAIRSALDQSLTDLELVVVNDGSTDGTAHLLSIAAAADSRVRVLSKPNTGLSDSLNVGMRAARGEWIARLDADDLAEKGRLQAQMDHLRARPEMVLLGTGFREIDESGAVIATHLYPTEHNELVRNLVRARSFFPHSSAVFQRDVALSLGGYNPQVAKAQDWDLWLRLSEHGQVASLPAPLVRIRRHADRDVLFR